MTEKPYDKWSDALRARFEARNAYKNAKHNAGTQALGMWLMGISVIVYVVAAAFSLGCVPLASTIGFLLCGLVFQYGAIACRNEYRTSVQTMRQAKDDFIVHYKEMIKWDRYLYNPKLNRHKRA